MVDQDEIRIEFRGLVLGDWSLRVNSLTGWLDLPEVSFDDEPTEGHGLASSPAVHGARIVEASGLMWAVPGPLGSRPRRSVRELLTAFRAASTPRTSTDATLDELRITCAGQTETAEAKMVGYSPRVEVGSWGTGAVPWSARWRCPDPRKYSPWQRVSTSLVKNVAGALLPQTMPFLMPAQPLGGELRIFNPGNDPEGSPAVITMTGQQPGNVGVRVNDAVISYPFGLDEFDVLVIDTERGGAYLNGAYRQPSSFSSITSDLRLRPGMNLVRASGLAGAGTPSITVAVRPRSW